MKISIINLGCSKNLVDAENFAGELEQAGATVISESFEADIIIINTCGFIQSAKEESIENILEAVLAKQAGYCKKIIVSGCLSERYQKQLELEIPEADAILKLADNKRIVDICYRLMNSTPIRSKSTSILTRKLFTPSHLAYVKIADGCNNRCSYCAIPLIRGDYYNRSPNDIIKEIEALAINGVKEIDLIAQDITYYGHNKSGHSTLADLLHSIIGIEGINWIRLLYTHPAHYTDELISVIVAEEKICNYLDLPLQHISASILESMGRKVTPDDIYSLIEKLRFNISDLVLRTTFLIGYPGETEENFEELLNFIEKIRFDKLGAFTYSAEEDTAAALLPNQIEHELAEERRDILMELQQGISEELLENYIGKTLDVMIDELDTNNDYPYVGRTRGDAYEIDGIVYLKGDSVQIGDIVKVHIIGSYEYDLVGEII